MILPECTTPAANKHDVTTC